MESDEDRGGLRAPLMPGDRSGDWLAWQPLEHPDVQQNRQDIRSISATPSSNITGVPVSSNETHHFGGGSVGRESRRGMAATSRKDRRLRQLGRSNAKLSTMQLRQLFRNFDRDNDNRISYEEFRRGLIAMGYDAATNPVAVTRLLEQVDEDKTGFISENQFISYFRNWRRNDLQKELEEFKGELHVVIRAITFRTFGSPAVECQRVPPESFHEFFRRWSERAHTDDSRLWLDITGYNETLFEMLEQCLGFHQETTRDAAIFQQQKVEAVLSTDETVGQDERSHGTKSSKRGGNSISPSTVLRRNGAPSQLQKEAMRRHAEHVPGSSTPSNRSKSVHTTGNLEHSSSSTNLSRHPQGASTTSTNSSTTFRSLQPINPDPVISSTDKMHSGQSRNTSAQSVGSVSDVEDTARTRTGSSDEADSAFMPAIPLQREDAIQMTSQDAPISQLRAQILVHAVTLENLPLRHYYDANRPCKLSNKFELNSRPPNLVFEQVSILVRDDRIIVTIHNAETLDVPDEGPDDDDTLPKQADLDVIFRESAAVPLYNKLQTTNLKKETSPTKSKNTQNKSQKGEPMSPSEADEAAVMAANRSQVSARPQYKQEIVPASATDSGSFGQQQPSLRARFRSGSIAHSFRRYGQTMRLNRSSAQHQDDLGWSPTRGSSDHSLPVSDDGFQVSMGDSQLRRELSGAITAPDRMHMDNMNHHYRFLEDISPHSMRSQHLNINSSDNIETHEPYPSLSDMHEQLEQQYGESLYKQGTNYPHGPQQQKRGWPITFWRPWQKQNATTSPHHGLAQFNNQTRLQPYDIDSHGHLAHNTRGTLFERIYRQLLRRLLEAEPEDDDIRGMTAKSLSVEIAECIMQLNFQVRDRLMDWSNLLESHMRDVPHSDHVAHLYHLSKTATIYGNSIQQVRNSLEPQALWNTQPRSAVARFFSAQEVDLTEIYDDVSFIATDIESMKANLRELRSLYSTLQNDQMNRVLYFLTVVTTVVVPGQFLTGVYGMNFEVMPELQWKWSYPMFWLIMFVSSVGILVMFKRWKLFAVL